jgi:glycosyltransferase involved in cell wall biosynthesis
MNIKDRLIRKFKSSLIKKYISVPFLVLAQTETAKERLIKFTNIPNIEIVSNAVSIDNLTGGVYKNFELPNDKVKFLYLTKYYEHKNIEIFLPVAKLIKQRQLPYVLILTIDEHQHRNARKFINNIKYENLEDVIINVGSVAMKNVPSLYRQTDALLMPTLLESFSGTYVEAMYHQKPIFTSNLDFAKDVCSDAAFYFDPLNAENIVETIDEKFKKNELIHKIIQQGTERLLEFPSWNDVFNKLMNIINNAICP